jgi:hypothetical protein
LAAIVLAAGLGVLDATDARAASGLAWYGALVSVVILAAALAAGTSAGIQLSLVPLAALLLLRHHDRLLLAPIYGACLLLVSELGQRSIELRGQARLGPQVVSRRLLTVLTVAAVGACAAALTVLAVAIAPAPAVGLTAVGAVAIVAAVGMITRLARREPDLSSE